MKASEGPLKARTLESLSNSLMYVHHRLSRLSNPNRPYKPGPHEDVDAEITRLRDQERVYKEAIKQKLTQMGEIDGPVSTNT